MLYTYYNTYYTYILYMLCYTILYIIYYSIVRYSILCNYIQLYCTTIGVQPAPSQCATNPAKKRGRYHACPRKDDKKCEHKCTKCKCNSFVKNMQSKHLHMMMMMMIIKSNQSSFIPAYPALFHSLLMQNDTVQHLLKSHFVYIVISLSLYFYNLAKLHLFVLI